jgi:hypothetical protein
MTTSSNFACAVDAAVIWPTGAGGGGGGSSLVEETALLTRSFVNIGFRPYVRDQRAPVTL